MVSGEHSDRSRAVKPQWSDFPESIGEPSPVYLLVMNRPAKLAVSILVTVGIVLAGCSNSSRPPTYPVTGTVTMQGKPVAGAAVTFVPTGKEGEAASAI